MNKAIILAGGQGKRMKADMPKPLFKVLGEPMLEWVISACESAGVGDICVVKGFMGEMIDDYVGSRCRTVLQAERLGTGHAVMQAVPFLKEDESGNTLVLCGDAPFIDEETIRASLAVHEEQGNAVTGSEQPILLSFSASLQTIMLSTNTISRIRFRQRLQRERVQGRSSPRMPISSRAQMTAKTCLNSTIMRAMPLSKSILQTVLSLSARTELSSSATLR